MQLIALDLEWPEGWWNSGPNERFLEIDIRVLAKFRPEAGRELELALLAADLATQEFAAGKAKDLVTKAGLLADQPTLPANGRVLSFLLTFIHDHEISSKEEITKTWGAAIKVMAKESTDPELHNALAWLHLESPELEEIDLQGWKQTGDARFVASYLGVLMRDNKLTLESPHLVKALAEFPDNHVVQSIPLGLTKRDSPRYREALIETIKADYMLLPRAGVFPRRSAKPLRLVFEELAELAKP